MFDFLRDRGSTAADKRQEALSAYLDKSLTAAERERLEGLMARDTTLRDEMERMRLLKLQMRAMPRRRVPRSFALDPALYGRPQAQPGRQLYPVLRGATALTAFFLIFTLALGMFQGQFAGNESAAPAAISESVAVEDSAAIGVVEAPQEQAAGGAEEARIMATETVAELAAPAPITETFAIEALPPVAGTLTPETSEAVTAVPGADLALEAPLPAETSNFEATAETASIPETAVEEEEAPALDTADTAAPEDTVNNTEVVAAEEQSFSSSLRPLQIGLGVLFLLLLVTWLIVRRRVRSF
ncbi:MAG: hypothetical protein KA586_10845 [Candidatus Promineofilum sp.]|nr:hypothetical protein [Promineifilum sp.]